MAEGPSPLRVIPPGDGEASVEATAPEETAAGETGYEPRGAHNPRIVDLIARDPERDEVVLAIFEPRPWDGSRRRLLQLEDKLNSYFGYVLDGFLAREYPDYDGMPVCIRLDCIEEPGEAEKPFMAAAARFSAAHGLRFEVRVVDDPFARRAPWERRGE